MRFTINDIARKAGVSRATVSRVINNKPDVEENTRLSVLKIMEETNYVPNNNATGLRTRKTNLIALLTTSPNHPATSLNHPWQNEVFLGVLEKLEEYSYKLLLYTSNHPDDTPESSREFGRFLNSGLADGLIVFLPSTVQDHFQKLTNSGLPFVVIDDYGFTDEMDIPQLSVNGYQGALEATRHLISLGHQQIAFISNPPEYKYSQERLAGYKEGLSEASLAFNPNLVSYNPEPNQEKGGYQCALALLNLNTTSLAFTALFAATDMLAFGAIRALGEQGIRIPEDISLVGFDDIPRASYSVPALTTVHQPMHEIGQMAVTMLMDQIECKPLDLKKVELATELRIRASTRAK